MSAWKLLAGPVGCLLLATSPVVAEPRHVVVRTEGPIKAPVPAGGLVQVVGERVVVAFWHAGGFTASGSILTAVLDRKSLETRVEYVNYDPAEMRFFAGTAYFGCDRSRQGPYHLVDLDKHKIIADLRTIAVSGGPDCLYSLSADKVLRRWDERDAGTRWEAKLPSSLWSHVGCRRGVWVQSFDRRSFTLLAGGDGKVLERYEVPEAEAKLAESVNMVVLPDGDEDRLVVMLPGVKAGKGEERGTLFRLVDGKKPKDMLVRGARPYLSAAGRMNGVRVFSFQRQGKTFTAIEGRQDGKPDGEVDSYWAVELKKWKQGARTPIVPGPGFASDSGQVTAGKEVWDVGAGKKLASLGAEKARWVEVTAKAAAEWDPEAKALRLHPHGGQTIQVALPAATDDVECIGTRDGQRLAVLAKRAEGTSTLTAVDPAGVVTSVGEHGKPTTLIAAADAGVDGVWWVLLAETEGNEARMHLYGIEVASR